MSILFIGRENLLFIKNIVIYKIERILINFKIKIGDQMASEKPIFKDITPQEAAVMINENKNNPQFVLLDVRTPAEFESAHLSGAKNLDYPSNTFLSEIEKLDKSKKYMLYCRSGMRSANALQLMRSKGFKELYHMLGGITLWADEGFPLVR